MENQQKFGIVSYGDTVLTYNRRTGIETFQKSWNGETTYYRQYYTQPGRISLSHIKRLVRGK